MQAQAQALRKAMEGWGTDEDALIKVVANVTNNQRQQIKSTYKTMYGRDLIEDIKSECHGKFEDALVDLFKDPLTYDCEALHDALKGAGTNEDTLIEIIISRPTPVLAQIKQKYKQLYGDDLEKKVASDTSGTLKHILVSILQCKRSTNAYPNTAQCQAQAKAIYDAGEAKMGTDESVFNQILCNASPAEILEISKAYYSLTGHSILEAIDKEFSGDSKKAFRTIVYATLSPSEYFATRVQDAIKGWGTKDRLLMRILITRDEIDMPQIKAYFKKLYGKDMVEAVKSELSGDYKKLMVELCSH